MAQHRSADVFLDNFHPVAINEPAHRPTDKRNRSSCELSSSTGDFSSTASHNTRREQIAANLGRKRSRSGTGHDNNNEEENDLDISDGRGFRQKRPNTGLQLRCVFRARNPIKFNVRDHYSCAMTYFRSFSDLRQHILKKHSREGPQKFVCVRCNRSYEMKKELEAHVRVPIHQVCELIDLDPEDGIDSFTAKRIIDRRRICSGPTDQDQWNDIWALVFPDDIEIPSYKFQAVIEHFELAGSYTESIQDLQPCLQGLGLSDEVQLVICERVLENFDMAKNKLNVQAREIG
ncbi:hypothetical protein GQ53DRAFT_849727 [Thozetella sp. PMI_491]|nr:hypothetical protein GQ53DRAFT_849727 [Thozetella sp. PMI_491]